MRKSIIIVLTLIYLFLFSCHSPSEEVTADETKDSVAATKNVSIKEEAVSYNVNGTTFNGFVYYDEKKQGQRPIVLVVPEWWGLTDYPKMRAKMLAELGYFAMAVDMYGSGKTVDNPTDAQNAATPFYQNPLMAKQRLEAALTKAKTYPQADTSNTAAIGYCFGGSMVLHSATLGIPFNGVVSIHGGLDGVKPTKNLSSQILVIHGGNDSFVPEEHVTAFKKAMDSAKANYTFKVYPNATHAFTNPDADKKGEKFGMPIQYNGAADTASWNDMKSFLGQIFK